MSVQAPDANPLVLQMQRPHDYLPVELDYGLANSQSAPIWSSLAHAHSVRPALRNRVFRGDEALPWLRRAPPPISSRLQCASHAWLRHPYRLASFQSHGAPEADHGISKCGWRKMGTTVKTRDFPVLPAHNDRQYRGARSANAQRSTSLHHCMLFSCI